MKNEKINMKSEYLIDGQISIFELSDIEIIKPTYAFEKVNEILNNYEVKNNSISYMINLNKKGDYSSLQTFYEFLDLLSNMQVLEYAKIKFAKASSDFEFEYASSGEKQILYTLLTINTYIQSNSLVLIDEPEISLHPNWQMKYIKLL